MVRIVASIFVIAFLSCGCGQGRLEDADLYGVYVADVDGYVDLLVLDSTREYTRMYWEASGGKQVYTGDWALIDWMGDTRVDFHHFGRLYEDEYPRPPGNWPALVMRSLFGNIRLPISIDDGLYYNKVRVEVAASDSLFDSLISHLTNK